MSRAGKSAREREADLRRDVKNVSYHNCGVYVGEWGGELRDSGWKHG